MGDSPPKYGFLPNLYPQLNVQNDTLTPQLYSGVALSYGMPVPYQQQQSLVPSTPESPQTTPYPIENPCPEFSGETQSTQNQDTSQSNVKFDSSGYSWQFIGPDTPFPYNVAVRAGRDSDGTPIFVGRAFHEGDMLPAKVHPDKHVAYVSYNGEEVAKFEYEILRSGDFVWEFATGGEVPIGSIEVGKTAEGEALFIARCLHQGTQTPGKLHPSHGCLYIPFNGEEVTVHEYEVLVLK